MTVGVTRPLDSGSRRNFLRRTGTLASGALATGASLVHAQPLAIPESNTGLGKPIPADDYGVPSKYEAHVRRRRSDVLKNRQNFSDWSMTPLQHQHGIVTPNGLFFERHHAGTPDIDPAKHKLVIHGMVKQPLEFTMEALTRYPSVSKFYFLECSGNGLTDWLKAASTTVQQTHGLLSCAQWTGIPVSWLLDEAGLAPGASWLAFEGADGSGHTRSLPLKKVLDDCLIVYAQNGEMLRPEQGYPVRLLVPGWEGNVSVKWLRRIKVGDEPWYFRSETARYTDPMPEGKWRKFSFEMECKSVVTSPSGGMAIRPGTHEIEGFAWSGNGKIRAVDVTARRRRDVARGAAGRAGVRQVSDAFSISLGLGRRAGDDCQPCRGQHRLRAAHRAGDCQGPCDHRVRPASQWHFPVVDQRKRRGQECDRLAGSWL